MTLKELRDALSVCIGQMDKLSDKTKNEDGSIRLFSADEQKEYETLEKRAQGLNDAIEREKKVEDLRASVKQLSEASDKAPRIEVTREKDHDESGQYRGFRSFGEQMQSIARSSTPGRPVDERLGFIARASGLQESVDHEGGYLIQSDFMLDLVRDTYDNGRIASLCRRIPISQNSTSIELPQINETSRATGSRGGGVRAYWRAEAATVTASDPDFTSTRIMVDDLMAICYITDQLLSDVPALDAFIRSEFADEMAFVLDDAILRGDGVGKPLGILSAPCLVQQAKKSAQTADTIVWENVSAMRMRMFARGFTRAVWLANSECMQQLEQMYVPISSGNGLPMYSPAGSYGQEGERIYGRPLLFVEQASALGDVGDIVLGDFSQYYLIEKGTIDAQTSIHVKFLYGENTFRFTMRVGGQPRRKSAVDPYKGSLSKSDFVALAAR